MKTEICAEVHAKVAYSMRIMLDKFHEDLKSSLQSYHDPRTGDECSCKELKKGSEKLSALCCSQNLKAKEETKKRLKRIQQEIKKSNKLQKNVSESDTDNEKNVDMATPTNLITAQKYDPPKVSPPVPPRKSGPSKILVQTADSFETLDIAFSSETTELNSCNILTNLTKLLNLDRQELLNGSTEILNIEEQSPEYQLHNSEKEGSSQMTTAYLLEKKLENQSTPNALTTEVFSPSDSEFEVISMPPNANPVSQYARCK